MDQRVTVAIIEDHPVVTEGVTSWIRSDIRSADKFIFCSKVFASSPISAL